MATNDKKVTTVAPRTASTVLLLGAGLLVPVLFITVMLIEGAQRPEYQALHRFGSELALGGRGWVMIANFIVTGLLVLGFAAGLRHVLAEGRGSKLAPVLAALFGLCMMVSGVFVTDPTPGNPEGMTVPPEPTLHGIVHDANPVPFYLSLVGLICVMAYRFAAEPGGRPWMWYCIATAIAIPATFVIAAYLYDMDSGTGAFHGLWQRINLTISLAWIAAVAIRYLRYSRRARWSMASVHRRQ